MAKHALSKYENIISQSIEINPKSQSPKVYQMNPRSTKIGSITCRTVGERKANHTNRTILLVGETGCGKSTLINALVNYAMGVTWEDQVWFKIVNEVEGKQVESQTSDVVVYKVIGFEDQTLPFSLTLIDTPGFGATKGTQEDNAVPTKLYELFRSPMGVKEIHAVGLVVKASENRRSDRQLYILNSVMSLFGKDMEKNIILLITHSNDMVPTNVFEALEVAGYKCGKNEKNEPIHFLFDNCKEIKGEQKERALKYADGTSTEGMMGLKAFLETIKHQNVEESMNVLAKRIRLTACIQNLKERIQKITMKQTEILKAQEAVKKCKEEGGDTLNIPVMKTLEKSIKGGWWFFRAFYDGVTRCPLCKENCHYPGCTHARRAEKCEVMKNGNCTSCKNKCPASKHVKDENIYFTEIKTETKTLFDAEEKYGLNKCQKELEDLKADKKRWLQEAYQQVVKLKKIGLITNAVSTHIHLDDLIQMLKDEGDEDKAKELEEVQAQLEGLRAAIMYKLMGK